MSTPHAPVTMFVLFLGFSLAVYAAEVTKLAGVPAPTDLELQDTAGEMRRLKDFRGRVVLVNFWASWCPPPA